MPQNDQDICYYLRERPDGGLCLSFATLTIQLVHPVCGHSKLSAEGIKNRVVTNRSKVPRGASLFRDSVTLTEEKHRLQITFWCKSGTEFSPPTTFEPNCAEIAVFQYSTRVLEEVEHQGYAVAQTHISYITDLSPCPACTRNIPSLEKNLELRFRDIQFYYHQSFVLQYFEYITKSKEEQKFLKSKEYWRSRRENV